MTSAQKRSTVYFDPQVHRALRLKAAETDRSISELVNEATRDGEPVEVRYVLFSGYRRL